jgi:hypothetical protein
VIVNLAQQTIAKCFVELDEAVTALEKERGGGRVIALNAHRGEAPPGAIILQTENVPGQVSTDCFPDRTIWDFSSSNVAKWEAAGRKATHFKVGYHPSFERFKRAKDLDVDVVFSGVINERRAKVLNALQERGHNVVVVPVRLYGRGRDALLARAKLALNLLFYPDGVFPSLRVAHLVANHVPVLSEKATEGWGSNQTTYDRFVDEADALLRGGKTATENAARDYEDFRSKPMELPS